WQKLIARIDRIGIEAAVILVENSESGMYYRVSKILFPGVVNNVEDYRNLVNFVIAMLLTRLLNPRRKLIVNGSGSLSIIHADVPEPVIITTAVAGFLSVAKR